MVSYRTVSDQVASRAERAIEDGELIVRVARQHRQQIRWDDFSRPRHRSGRPPRPEFRSRSRAEQAVAAVSRPSRPLRGLSRLQLNAGWASKNEGSRISLEGEEWLIRAGTEWLGLSGARQLVASPVQDWQPLPALWNGKSATRSGDHAVISLRARAWSALSAWECLRCHRHPVSADA